MSTATTVAHLVGVGLLLVLTGNVTPFGAAVIVAVLIAVRGLLALVNVGIERGLYAPRTARVATLGAAVVGGARALVAGDTDLGVAVVVLAALVLLVDAYGDGRSPIGTDG